MKRRNEPNHPEYQQRHQDKEHHMGHSPRHVHIPLALCLRYPDANYIRPDRVTDVPASHTCECAGDGAARYSGGGRGDVGMQIGLRLRERRVSLGLSQGAVTRGLLDRSYLSRIEHGQVVPSLDILEALARRLGLPLASLLSSAEYAKARALQDLVRMADINGSEKAFHKAWACARECKDLPVMTTIVSSWFERCRHPRPSDECLAALSCTFDGISLASADLTPDIIAIGLHLAEGLYMHDKFSESTRVYQELLRVNPMPTDMAKVLIGAGSSKFRECDYAGAVICYEHAIDIVESTNESRLIAQAHHGAGICLRELRNNKEARRHTELAHSLYAHNTDKWYETLHNSGILELDDNHSEAAMDTFNQCWKFYIRNGDSKSAGLLAEEFARVEVIKGDMDAAQCWVREGLRQVAGDHPRISGRLWIVSEIVNMGAHRSAQADDARLAGQSCLGNHYETVRGELSRQFSALPRASRTDGPSVQGMGERDK